MDLDPLGFGLLRRREVAGWLVDAPVAMPTLDGVSGVHPFALDPHELRQPRAVDGLVEHPHRDRRLVRGQLGKWELDFGLFGIHQRMTLRATIPAAANLLMLPPRPSPDPLGGRERKLPLRS